MRANPDTASLIRLLEKFGRREGTVCREGFVILFSEAANLLESGDDQGDGGQLGFAVRDFVLVQGEGLTKKDTLLFC